MQKSAKRNKAIAMIATICILIAGAIVCVVILWPRPLTLQQQLNQFKAGLELLSDTEPDSDGNPAPRNVVRNIIVTEDDKVVVEYIHTVKIYVDTDKTKTAYLSAEERYPSLDTAEFNVFDEYYLSNGVMHTRRENDGDVNISSFNSDIDTFFAVMFENVGNAKYDFSEGNFSPLKGDGSFISREGDVSKLTASINTYRYANFFGESTDTSDITDVMIEAAMVTKSKDLSYFKLAYNERGRKVLILIKAQEKEPVSAPEWI